MCNPTIEQKETEDAETVFEVWLCSLCFLLLEPFMQTSSAGSAHQ
jgi:hypothetical protein